MSLASGKGPINAPLILKLVLEVGNARGGFNTGEHKVDTDTACMYCRVFFKSWSVSQLYYNSPARPKFAISLCTVFEVRALLQLAFPEGLLQESKEAFS